MTDRTDDDLLSAEVIDQTFTTLGLLQPSPAGYNYVSTWNAIPTNHIFDVVFSTSSRGERA